MVMESASEIYDCYFIDDNYNVDDVICGIKVVGKISEIKNLKFKYENLIVAIGNNILREKLTNEAISYGFKIPNIFGKNFNHNKISDIISKDIKEKIEKELK